MESTTFTKEQLIELRKTDFSAYNRLIAKKCYDTNETYKEKKKEKMRNYYYDNKDSINEKYKIYRKEYYRAYRAKKKAEKESISLHTVNIV